MRHSDKAAAAQEDRTLALKRPDVVVRSTRALGAEGGRPVVVVLGMHRSGTSLLSNILHYLGVDMADMTDHTGPKNAGGFWERPELVAIHDEILAAIDRPIGRASHVLPFPPAWWRRKEVQALKPRLLDYVREQLAKSGNLWGFKDPRTCRLLPLWWEVFRELNLRPVYVHAVRAPAEASVSMSQKSSARKMSVASGELMWLAYNYDVVRYVTAEHPTVLVNYDEWFSDGPGVAHRLIDELGIGDDLTPEDVDECVASIVHREYRHQVAGENGLASNIPMATMLYDAITASNPLNSADALGLRRQLRLVDLFLKSISSIANELDAATVAQAALLDDQRELIEQHAVVQQDAATRLAAVRASLGEAKMLGEKSQEAAEQEVRARKDLTNQLVAMESEWAAVSEQLTMAIGRGTQLETQLATVHEDLRLALEAAREQSIREAEEVAAREQSDREAKDAAARAEQSEVDLAALRAELCASRQEYSLVEQRNLEFAEQLAVRDQEIAALRADLAASLQHASLVDVQNLEFAEQIEARDQEISALRERDQQRDPPVEADSVSFGWPVDATDYGVEGRVSNVDDNGIGGEISLAKRSDIIPIVEVRVGAALVLAQACVAAPLVDGSAQAGVWQFLIPWSRFAEKYAGQQVVVRMAGLDLELGHARLPVDLRLRHVSPARLAAELIGGTVTEAEDYHRWIARHELASDLQLARTYRSNARKTWPRITVIVHGGEADRDAFAATLQSLRAQVFGHWEALCVGAPEDVAAIDARARVVAASALGGELVRYQDDALLSFVEANDRLAPTALLHLVTAALAAPDFGMIYSDEDRIDPRSGTRALPYMKGDWSVDLALAQDYVSRLALVRRKSVVVDEPLDAASVSGLALRAALAGDGTVVHLPFVLYHRAAANIDRGKDYSAVVAEVLADQPAAAAGARVIPAADGRWRIEWPLPNPVPRVSLIVPTRDRVDLLRVCIDGFLNDTSYNDLEILIADNDSVEEDALAYLAKVSSHPRVRVISCPGAFNYSAINNLAATHATGSLLGLMNNDLKVIDPDWLRQMVSHAVRPDVGIVGAKLLHGDGSIQHAGVTLGISIASHLYKSFARDATGHNDRLTLPQDVSAVTAACLLMRREVWDEVGGLDEEFPVAYNDIDLCLKVRRAGYRVVWTPDVLVYHLESQSRGKDATPEKRERLDQDKARLVERWGDLLLGDRFHSPNLSNRHVDARLAFPSRATPPWRPEAQSTTSSEPKA